MAQRRWKGQTPRYALNITASHTPVRVALVDDEASLRFLLRASLESRPGFEVVGEAADGGAAVDLVARTQPDVVVLDLGLPDLSGLEVIPRIRAVAPMARVVVFTGSVEAVFEGQAKTAGAHAFAVKGPDLRYLLDLLERIGKDTPNAAVIELAPRLQSAEAARRFVHDRCEDWGCTEMLEAATLIVSELVTNAIVHAATPAELRAQWSNGVLRLEVMDNAEGSPPDPRIAAPEDENGRGLLLVDALSSAWGVESTDRGKVVWAEVANPQT